MRGLAVAVILVLAAAAPASARPLDPSCTDTFQVVGPSRDWNTAANWTRGVPTPTDDVCILDGIPTVGTATPVIRSLYAPDTQLGLTGDFTVTGGATVGSLVVSGGTLSVGGPLAIAGTLDLSDGTVTSPADATIGKLAWSGGTLGGAGTTTVSGNAALVGGTLSGRTLRLAGASTLSPGPGIGGTGALAATGPLTVHAPATIAVPFTAGGAVSVDGGVLTLTGGGSGAGPYAVADGATLDWAGGTFALAAPVVTGAARISGADVTTAGDAHLGALAVASGSLTVNGTLAAGPTSLSGGLVAGPGALALTKLDWSGGTLAGSGTTTVGALAVSGAGATLSDGTLAVTGDSTLAAPLELDGRLENGGVMDVQGDTGISGGGLLVNTGTLRKSATINGVTLVGVPLDNDGLLDAEAGTLRLTGGSGIGEVSTGAYTAAAGAMIDWRAGAYTLAAPVESGAGTALVSGGALGVTGPARFATLVVIAGGADFAGPLTADTVSLAGGTLSGADMTIGRLAWTAGSLTGSGTTTVGAGGLTLTGPASKPLRGRTLALTGDSSATGGPLVLAGGAAIRNAALLDLSSDASVTGAGTLTNAGTLRKSGGTGTATIALPVDNQGTVDVESGTLALASLADGTLSGGTYQLAGTLLVPGLDITANAGTLRLAASGALSDGTGDALAGLATNTGTLELDGRDLALTGGLANSGTVRLGGATLTTAGPYVQSAGLTSLDGGTLHAGAPVQLDGGQLAGTGTVLPGLRNGATVAPGTPLTVTGDYVQAPAGTLAAPPGRLAVSGTATLDGTLAIDPAAVSDGVPVPLLTASTVTGQWAAPPATNLYSFGVGYDATSATLTAHKIPDVVPCGDCLPPHPFPCCVPNPDGGGAEVASGTVLIKPPGDKDFTPLGPGDSVPVGSVVDARAGTLALSIPSKFDPKAPPTQLSVTAAIFQLKQELASDGHTTVTDLVVRTPAGLAHACAPRKGVVRSRHATIRRIRARVTKGFVRVRGAAAMLTTRKASFSMRDRCDGTSTRLVSGTGTVFDRVTGRRVRLRAHQAYVARTKLFLIRQARLRRLPKP